MLGSGLRVFGSMLIQCAFVVLGLGRTTQGKSIRKVNTPVGGRSLSLMSLAAVLVAKFCFICQ